MRSGASSKQMTTPPTPRQNASPRRHRASAERTARRSTPQGSSNIEAMQTSHPSLARISTPRRAGRTRAARHDARAAALFIGPNLLLFTVFVGIPIVAGCC